MKGTWGPRLLLAAAVAALVACVWRAGIDPDEQIQLSALLGQPILERATGPFHLYDFSHVGEDVRSDLARGRELVYRGDVKWCQAPFPVRIDFFRPLSSAFLSLELSLFGFHFRLYHLVHLALAVLAAAAFAALANRALAAAGAEPIAAPILVALLLLNPLNQELLGRLCTVHYALVAIFGFGAYLALASEELAAVPRAALVLGLGAASVLAGELALPVHVIGGAAVAGRWRRLDRLQRALWALTWVGLGAYLLWYRSSGYGAIGRGYSGSTVTSGASGAGMVAHGLDGTVDLLAGAFLVHAASWRGYLRTVGTGGGLVACALGIAFIVAVGLAVTRVARARGLAAALVVAAVAAAAPVAALGQQRVRVLALGGFAMQLFLVLVARDAWTAWRARGALPRPRRAGAALGVGVVLVYATARLALGAALTPVTLARIAPLSEIEAARWRGDLDVSPGDIRPAAGAASSAPLEAGNVLLASGITGVPYPFGPALLARGGRAPDVGQWLFLSDLPPGTLDVEHVAGRTYRVSIARDAPGFDARHDALYPLAQRCLAQAGGTFETRFASFHVGRVNPVGEPLLVDVTFTDAAPLRFWDWRDGRIVPAELPAVGERARF